MSIAEPRPSLEEIARLGQEAYERCVRPALRPEDAGKFVAIDIRTDEYSIATTSHDAITQLRDRMADPEVFVMRTDGSPAMKMRSPRVYSRIS